MIEPQYFQHYKYVIGVDEVGRGCLAGPVTAGAVMLKVDQHIEGAKDSKKLSAKKRAAIAEKITSTLPTAVAHRSAQEIDKLNILRATLSAMKDAVESVCDGYDKEQCVVLVDGNHEIPGLSLDQECVIKGDAKSHAIACASIVAKETRDAIMIALEDEKGYQFAKHKGYGTRAHYEALAEHGASVHHRQSFRLAGGYMKRG